MNQLTRLTLTAAMLFTTFTATAQMDIIEIDSLTSAATKVMPYNKSFTIKVPVDADDMSVVHMIKKHKYLDFSGTIAHYTRNGKTYTPTEIPATYYTIKKIGEKNFLFLTFADKYMLEPSSSYFIILTHKKLGKSVLGFFDNYYASQYGPAAARPAAAAKALQSLTDFESSMQKIFGATQYGYYAVHDYTAPASTFLASFNANVQPQYVTYTAANVAYMGTIAVNTAAIAAALPDFALLSNKQLLLDATINKEALAYLFGKDGVNNNIASDANTVVLQTRIADVLTGSIGLDCIFCNPVDVNSTLQNDINKRISNIDSSMKFLNNLKRSLYLLDPKNAAAFNVTQAITNTINWEIHLQTSKTELKNLLQLRKAIEKAITENRYDGFQFNYASMATGNCFMNFETRNKVLLTPDFGVVTPAITKKGKELDYGIVPYLGFHVNLMAVDKDLTFTSYKKHWKQYFSFMVGWSLVNLQKENKYANFFEKSSLLTGVGYRLSNVIRVSAGTQWLFKLGVDGNNDPTRKLKGIPYVGLSFDLNIKQYLNGFTDLLSGIGKTKAPEPTKN